MNSRYALLCASLCLATACSENGASMPGTEDQLCGPLNPSGSCAEGFLCLAGSCLPAEDFCSAQNATGLCPIGRTCLDGNCLLDGDLCSTGNPNGACATGLMCRAGQCLDDAEFCSVTNPTGLCASASQTCLDGTCRAPGDLCSTTNPTGVCTTGLTCRSGQCLADTLFCSMQNPTGLCAQTSESCIDGTCFGATDLCSPSNLTGVCPMPLSCINGSCAVPTPCSSMEPMGFCATGQTCIDGNCENNASLCSATNTTGMCSTGNTCIDGSCLDDGLLCSMAQPSGVCQTGSTCFENTCELDTDLCSMTNPSGLCATGTGCLDGSCVSDTLVCSMTNPTGLCSGTGTCFENTCVDPATLCSPTNTSGLCSGSDICDMTGSCVPSAGNCNCTAMQTCIDGDCRDNALLCSAQNPSGLCESGFDCVAGQCRNAGVDCSGTNQSGVCPVGELCQAGVCVPLDDGALCDDANPCTNDFFDYARNRCEHTPAGGACDDGNACTNDACVAGVCVGSSIMGCVEPPIIDPFTTPTNNSVLTLSGSKPMGSSVEIDGLVAVSENPDTTWMVTLNLSPGENVYVVRSVDQGTQSETVTVRVVYDATEPVTSLSPAGGVFLSGITVTVASDEPATVYYTTDGGTPDSFSDSFESVKEFRVFDDTRLSFLALDRAGNWEIAAVTADFEITGHGNGWSDGPTIEEPLTHIGATYMESNVYVVGGSDGAAPQAGAYEYDLAGQSWTTLPSLPEARAQLALVGMGSALYAIGGENVGVPKATVTTLLPGVDMMWTVDTVMPTTRFGLAAVAHDGKIYAFGGKTNSNTVLNNLEVFTPGGPGAWVNTVQQMPRARYAFGAVEHNDLIYLVGGEDDMGTPIAEVDVYDPNADMWSTVADLPTPRSFLSVAISRNLGSVSGGYIGVVAAGGKTAGGAPSAVVEEFVIDDGHWRERTPLDIERHSAGTAAVDTAAVVDSTERQVWMLGGQTGTGGGAALSDSSTNFVQHQDFVRRLADAPQPRFMHAAAALDGKIYLFGGRDFQEEKHAWVFDPETESFTDLPALDTFQSGPVAVAVGDRVYAIGGADNFGNAVATVRAFDPVTNQWADLRSMQTGRRDAAVAVVDGEIYVIGGHNAQALQTVEIYDIGADDWRSGIALAAGRTGAKAVSHHGTIYLFGGRDTMDNPVDTILSFNGGWSTESGNIDTAYGTVTLLGEDQVSLFSGRDGQTLTQRTWSYNLGTNDVWVPARPGQEILAAYDHSASAVVNGWLYIFGGNSADMVGPNGETVVQKVNGRCFNGILDGRETGGADGADGGGGCADNPYEHHTGTGITFYNDFPPDISSVQRAIDACNQHYGVTNCARSNCSSGSASCVIIQGGGCTCGAGNRRWIISPTSGCTSYGTNVAGQVRGGTDACGSSLIGNWD